MVLAQLVLCAHKGERENWPGRVFVVVKLLVGKCVSPTRAFVVVERDPLSARSSASTDDHECESPRLYSEL